MCGLYDSLLVRCHFAGQIYEEKLRLQSVYYELLVFLSLIFEFENFIRVMMQGFPTFFQPSESLENSQLNQMKLFSVVFVTDSVSQNPAPNLHQTASPKTTIFQPSRNPDGFLSRLFSLVILNAFASDFLLLKLNRFLAPIRSDISASSY